MPKIFGKQVSPVVLVAATGLAAYLVISAMPGETPSGTSKRKLPAKKSTTQKGQLYTEADYTIRFASAPPQQVRNSFRPLVVRKEAIGSSDTAKGNFGVPNPFTGGEAGWVYSGMAEVNGVANALVENRQTGDAEFLQRGQRWKNSVILEIREDALLLSGPAGAKHTVLAGDGSELKANEGVSANSGVSPVTVPQNLVGQIGGNLGVQPMGDGSNQDRPRRGRRRDQGFEE